MKNKRVLVWSLIILLISLTVLLLYIYRDRLFKKSDSKGEGLEDQSENEIQPFGFPLQKGSNNNYVKKLQEYLLTKDPNCLPNYGPDGDFGDETESCAMSVLGIKVITYTKYKELGLQ